MSGQLASESARLLIALGCLKFVTLLSASSGASAAISRHMTSFALPMVSRIDVVVVKFRSMHH